MFQHRHPYKAFVPQGTTRLIIGTLPPPRFSAGNLYEEDVDFCYGSKNGLLWPLLEKIFNIELEYNNTNKAVEQRKYLLKKHHIGICDIVESCEREAINAADLGMKNIKFRDVFAVLRERPAIDTILFTGGNSKNGPEYLFRRYLKGYGIRLELISEKKPKIHQFEFDGSLYKTISLISPSGSANRSIGSDPEYKRSRKIDPGYSTFQYRLDQYSLFFMD